MICLPARMRELDTIGFTPLAGCHILVVFGP